MYTIAIVHKKEALRNCDEEKKTQIVVLPERVAANFCMSCLCYTICSTLLDLPLWIRRRCLGAKMLLLLLTVREKKKQVMWI